MALSALDLLASIGPPRNPGGASMRGVVASDRR
jgi:hypothetical protein